MRLPVAGTVALGLLFELVMVLHIRDKPCAQHHHADPSRRGDQAMAGRTADHLTPLVPAAF
jgi:hypothetical protein